MRRICLFNNRFLYIFYNFIVCQMMQPYSLTKISITLNHVNQIQQKFDPSKTMESLRESDQKFKFAEEESTNFLQAQKQFKTVNKFSYHSFKPNQAFLVHPAKSKYIYKIARKDSHKNKQEVRKVSSSAQLQFNLLKSNVLPEQIQKLKRRTSINMPLRKILDWMMEAAALLYLPKDSFYRSAIAMTFMYDTCAGKLSIDGKQNSWEVISSGFLSLSAKMDNASIPINGLLSKSLQNKITESKIAQAEVQILKKIKFRVPVAVNFFEQAILLCQQWKQFLVNKEACFRCPISSMQIVPKNIQVESPRSSGSSFSLLQTMSPGYKRFIQFTHLTDFIILNNPQRFLLGLFGRSSSSPTNKKGKWFQLPMTIAFAIVMTFSLGQDLPVRFQTNKTGYFMGYFEKFLISQLQWSNEDVMIWKNQLWKFAYEERCVQKLSGIPLSIYQYKQVCRGHCEFLDGRLKRGQVLYRQERGVQRYITIDIKEKSSQDQVNT